MTDFKLTAKQEEALTCASGTATHIMLYGGSRSGKTFLHVRNVVMRALKAPKSRHAILRYRFNHIKSSIVFDTFPKVMSLAFPNVRWKLNKSDWFSVINEGTEYASEIWFAGLDDKERTEKILGNEYATIYLNECSQIPWNGRNLVVTRLAQAVSTMVKNREATQLKTRMYYDCNPPNKAHWTYQLFERKVDPDTKEPVLHPENYVSFQMNPQDNAENLSSDYMETLDSLSPRLQKRFKAGTYADANPNALFPDEVIDKWRELSADLPDMVRIVVGVDPSGADDEDNADNDEIGIVVGGLGTDGNAYLLEDCTIKAGPATWGKVAVSAFERHSADVVVGETNYGGAMVGMVIQAARPRTPFQKVTASRGKVVRAEPFAELYDKGKIRHVGNFAKLEEELTCFTTQGYSGTSSPNRADAWVWVLTSLFPAILKDRTTQVKAEVIPTVNHFRR